MKWNCRKTFANYAKSSVLFLFQKVKPDTSWRSISVALQSFLMFCSPSPLAPAGSRTDNVWTKQPCSLNPAALQCSWFGLGIWWFDFDFFFSSLFLCLFHDCRQKKEELSQRIAEERARREEEEARRQEAEKKRKDAEEEREKAERLRRQAEEREQKEKEDLERIQKQVCSPLGIHRPVWLALKLVKQHLLCST